ncbi:hypothetical protein SAMN05444003_3279 [Cognatiyoonia sediminum]|uniref:Uncharacterized protein n=1 Tax=Cognatiyoonia sediminum TaxID=1508389 RepID=A0A1M5T7H2_9RHOB|nr:hypothetical protein SAMN05444003_3279 [Cognatiyoonia sediminum]
MRISSILDPKGGAARPPISMKVMVKLQVLGNFQALKSV